MAPEHAFPSRLLRFESASALAGPAFDPKRINMHLEGRVNGKRIMRDSEVEDLLKDPFATLVLRRDKFPRNPDRATGRVGWAQCFGRRPWRTVKFPHLRGRPDPLPAGNSEGR